MLLVFTEDVGTKFKQDETRDFLPHIWKGIARSAGKPLEKFTRDPSKPKRGRPRKTRG